MGWLEKVKLGVSALTLSQANEELLPIPGHKLRSKLDNIHVHWCNVRVIDYELVWRRWLDYLLLLTLSQHFHLFLPLSLLFFLSLGIDDCLWHLWLGLLHNSGFELLDLMFIVRSVGILRQQESELCVVLLSQHTRLKLW